MEEIVCPLTQAGSVVKRRASNAENCNSTYADDHSGYTDKSTSERGLPWWKLAKPVRSGRRRSLAELSTNSSVTSNDAFSGTRGHSLPLRIQDVPSPEEERLHLFGANYDRRRSDSSTSTSCQRPSRVLKTDPKKRPQEHASSSCWTLGSREGTEAPSPPEEEHSGVGAPDTLERGIDTPAGEVGASGRLLLEDSQKGLYQYPSADRSRVGSCSDVGSSSSGSALTSEERLQQREGPELLNCRTDPWRGRRDPEPTTETLPSATPTAGRRYDGSRGSASPSGVPGIASPKADVMPQGVDELSSPCSTVVAEDCSVGVEEEGLDDETALSKEREPTVVYDILAVDRGCGHCDTSVVPFPSDEGARVDAASMRAITQGQGNFLAKRGFAAGLVAHFLEETNCEFQVLQGESSGGMNAQQLEEAAIRLEEVFEPAVRRLRTQQSTEVVLDSLFAGADDAGEFVVRFEVAITRCHPDDIQTTSTTALRECGPTIMDALREEGVAGGSLHEVVFVGRPMWELVAPVLDLSTVGKANKDSTA